MIKGVLLDLGGVVYVGDSPVPGAAAAISRLRSEGFDFRFLTNVTRQSRAKLHGKLTQMGITIPEEELFTPAVAARRYLVRHKLRPHLVVHPALAEDFASLPAGTKQAVVVGDAGELFGYAVLNRAYRVLAKGAPLIALAANRVFRDSDGELSLDAGAFVAALEYASGQKAMVLGKPSGDFFHMAVGSIGCAPEEAVMVGDDVESDVGGALAAGLKGILVRTGKYEAGAERRIDPPPTMVAADLAAAAEWIQTHRSG